MKPELLLVVVVAGSTGQHPAAFVDRANPNSYAAAWAEMPHYPTAEWLARAPSTDADKESYIAKVFADKSIGVGTATASYQVLMHVFDRLSGVIGAGGRSRVGAGRVTIQTNGNFAVPLSSCAQSRCTRCQCALTQFSVMSLCCRCHYPSTGTVTVPTTALSLSLSLPLFLSSSLHRVGLCCAVMNALILCGCNDALS